MLVSSATARATMSALESRGFQQLLALPAVPVNNARQIRYPVTVTTKPDGGRWYLRSYGTTFDLVDPDRRGGRGRWYSLGWGLVDRRQVAELLLLHVGTADAAELDDIEAELASGFDEVDGFDAASRTSERRPGRWGAELRACAVLDRMPGGGC
ncbi:hypothetical protein POF50_002275 [Streptomyces sp. SL13]|uniref:Uncharacterized protein n=1 Tax=Streptantibioticus silvisoli TaxID=2705255 RepID=A0AA90H4W5_9ACTN|nr:hypothetical protein [Streptantibioticus silvisoli]MDI5961601.1 hypothetical protein [Streptantibioticus silvisoli]MDI5968182.1 hypothetical protein [Streptantibioticus silvisoli]